jgi:hypothetical protein
MFEIAYGSVIGRSHILLGVNNQDWYSYYLDPSLEWNKFVAIVCDGCGSGRHNEVGAVLGSRMVTNMLRDFMYCQKFLDKEVFTLALMSELAKIKRRLTSFIVDMSYRMGEEVADIVSNHFLFTIVGAISNGSVGAIFSLGDGCFALNGELTVVEPCEGNAPPYVGYNAIKDYVDASVLDESSSFTIHKVFDIRDLDSLLIGTDGVMDIEESSEKTVPGKRELVGSISQFWTNDLYFKNAASVTRKLVKIGRKHSRVKGGWLQHEQGHLSDDTTLIVIRRAKDEDISEGEASKD